MRNKKKATIDKMIPDMYGSPIVIENSHPPNGGPIILPSESNDDSIPVVLPCPIVDFFVSKADTQGLMTPLPRPKIVKKMAALTKLSTNKIKPNPIAEIIAPNWMTVPSPNFFVNGPTNPPCTIAPASPIIIKI